MKDIEKFTAAVAKMRRPQIRLNPVDFERLRTAVHHGLGALVAMAGIEIASDDTVPTGQMRVIEMAEPTIGPLVPMERMAGR